MYLKKLVKHFAVLVFTAVFSLGTIQSARA